MMVIEDVRKLHQDASRDSNEASLHIDAHAWPWAPTQIPIQPGTKLQGTRNCNSQEGGVPQRTAGFRANPGAPPVKLRIQTLYPPAGTLIGQGSRPTCVDATDRPEGPRGGHGYFRLRKRTTLSLALVNLLSQAAAWCVKRHLPLAAPAGNRWARCRTYTSQIKRRRRNCLVHFLGERIFS